MVKTAPEGRYLCRQCLALPIRQIMCNLTLKILSHLTKVLFIAPNNLYVYLQKPKRKKTNNDKNIFIYKNTCIYACMHVYNFRLKLFMVDLLSMNRNITREIGGKVYFDKVEE